MSLRETSVNFVPKVSSNRGSAREFIVAFLFLACALIVPCTCFASIVSQKESQKSLENRTSQNETKSQSQGTAPRDFSPPYPFTTQEFLVNLGKALAAKDGVVRKEVVTKAFQIEVPDKPRDEDQVGYTDKLIFLVLPGRDWFLGMKLHESTEQVIFQIWFDPYFCIGISQFRQFAEATGWEMVIAATLSGHMASPREYYKKRGSQAELFFDMSRPYLQCIGSIYVSTPK
ncbi:hypothetical protein RF679_04995 [Undibacterium cyanobacteriorum]|uniref:Nitroreductase domain-containing protein n=1 Tax=Undibacterium cyanobacteriorum TaxID=3073561 RepID=A0ABY9RK85_9BURK|nr:hypothetical protein [Undibacterium sp. 20NA77.5]WMW81637.1 hypothetical protein RF679_04995 [Undibacterium sp. 20NA77.5]